MLKLNTLAVLFFTLVTLVFSSCANQSDMGPTADTSTTKSPMNRNNNNGLTSYMH